MGTPVGDVDLLAVLVESLQKLDTLEKELLARRRENEALRKQESDLTGGLLNGIMLLEISSCRVWIWASSVDAVRIYAGGPDGCTEADIADLEGGLAPAGGTAMGGGPASLPRPAAAHPRHQQGVALYSGSGRTGCTIARVSAPGMPGGHWV